MNDNLSQTKVESWLRRNIQALEKEGIGTARLDCLVLLEDATGKDRSWLLAHQEFELDEKQEVALAEQIKQRQSHIPLAFIRGKTEFYGRDFLLTHDVLEPRPESETMIDLLKTLPIPHSAKIADVGTGSGALGITAKLELPDTKVDLIEIDDAAIAVAKRNSLHHGAKVHIYKSDLLSGVERTYDILLANLPYVPDDYHINSAAMMEPYIAIFGGPDGLDLYRRLFEQAQTMKSRYVLTESLPFQHDDLSNIASGHGYTLKETEDFIQVFEFIAEVQPRA